MVGADRDARPWEPSGEDFLSAILCEALLMREVLGADFGIWLADFPPDPAVARDIAHEHRAAANGPSADIT